MARKQRLYIVKNENICHIVAANNKEDVRKWYDGEVDVDYIGRSLLDVTYFDPKPTVLAAAVVDEEI